MNPHRLLLFMGLCVLLLGSCRKENLFTNDSSARLQFSRDTVLFDTVFTQPVSGGIPSVLKRFVARNQNNRAVRVNIALEGGTPSPFRINVDGVSGTSFTNVEILGNDSVFVFVEAALDQNNTGNPLIIEDRILFNTNGNQQQVQLIAWGQDAHYYFPDPAYRIPGLPPLSIIAGGIDVNGNPICETITWTNDKPHVIYGYAAVDSCSTLIIEPGVRVHVHAGGGLWVYRYGQINATGTFDQPITFQGDRLEPFYQELAGQWDRIWINEGAQDNVLEHVVVKNAFIGIQSETLPLVPGYISPNKLRLNNVKIRNCSAAGILSRNYRIHSTNLLVGDCGQYGVALTGGGEYRFNHSTIANYWTGGIRQTPAFIMTDRYQNHLGVFSSPQQIVNSTFVNSIVYGSNPKEFQLEIDDPGFQSLTFDRFIIRTDEPTNDPDLFPAQDRIWRNVDPGFASTSDRDFRLLAISFARNKASVIPGDVISITDIDGVDRNCDPEPDLGAYEFCP